MKKLWWELHEPGAPELSGEADAGVARRIRNGVRVGEVARERFPGGLLVSAPPWELETRAVQTAEVLETKAPAVFEASFLKDGLFAAVDVLERRGTSFAAVEVKSTTSVKESSQSSRDLRRSAERHSAVC